MWGHPDEGSTFVLVKLPRVGYWEISATDITAFLSIYKDLYSRCLRAWSSLSPYDSRDQRWSWWQRSTSIVNWSRKMKVKPSTVYVLSINLYIAVNPNSSLTNCFTCFFLPFTIPNEKGSSQNAENLIYETCDTLEINISEWKKFNVEWIQLNHNFQFLFLCIGNI